MTPVAYLYGIDTVAEAIEHEVVGQFVRELISDEIIPTIDLPKDELESFADAVIERFRNPYIQHYLLSISLNSTSKFKTRNLPSLLDYVERKQALPPKMVFSLAAMIAFYKGKRGEEETIKLSDDPEVLELFETQWAQSNGSKESLRAIAASVLGCESIWDMDLTTVPGLVEEVTDRLYEIETKGMKRAVEATLGQRAANQ